MCRTQIKFAIVEAPTTLGLKREDPAVRPGVHDLAGALKRAGFLDRVPAVRFATVEETGAYSSEPDPDTGILNARPVAAYSLRLADRIAEVFQEGLVPLILGGDCSVVIGAALALRRRGRFGFFSLDGHTDYYPPEHSPSRQVAAMELWLATGHGPALFTNLDGFGCLLDPRDVVMFGHRDDDDRIVSGAPDPSSDGIFCVPWHSQIDIRTEAHRAMEHLRKRDVAGVWLHIDADVLASSRMPAVDSPLPGGLDYEEFVSVIRSVRDSGLLVGCDITIFDPSQDPDGTHAGALCSALARALG